RLRKLYYADKTPEAPLHIKNKAAKLIQRVYRLYMKVKRKNNVKIQEDILIGYIADPFKKRLSLEEENNKIYERRRKTRMKLQETYNKEMERENKRLILFKKNNQIDDITDQINVWFKEWYYGYGFFPEYPFDIEGGTMLVLRGEYPTVEEKREEDEKIEAATKGKTPEQLKTEKEQAKLDAALKAEAEKEQQKREAEQLFKLRCNPFADIGYKVESSEHMESLMQALNKYRAAWSIYDKFPPHQCRDNVYGYIKSIMTDDLMCQLHQDCRVYVDELMRADQKLLVKMHQIMYKNVGWKYPKLNQRKKPKPASIPKPLNMDDTMLQGFEELFDLGIISRPKAKIKDIYGDSNYAAYDMNLMDPFAKFPPPGYGDMKTRLILSCVFASGIQAGAKRNKSVLLLGPARNGKSFLVDCVAGELNAIKIDITPEVFSAVLEKPAKVINQVFQAARVFQPCVIYMRNIERMFSKKASPLDKVLNMKPLKTALPKLLKTLPNEDKIIFIATCSNPFETQAKPMVSMFNEMILVPNTDYATVRQFFYEKLQRC
ncbi:IQ and AAA domain-containing protein 1-like, partial [Manduca sexta]|uniref:IQ and AAA domain-containing protein 1-like n=1 Tax=Manduca sexta TaxID=7130 RepID=UPI00188F595A